MEHALRDYARINFAKSLGTSGPLARNCERSVYNWAVQQTRRMNDSPSWENRIFKWRYKQKLLCLLTEMKRSVTEVGVELRVAESDRITVNLVPKPQLVHRLVTKKLEARNLAQYPPEVLWPDGPVATRMAKNEERDQAMMVAKLREGEITGVFKCGKCKTMKTTYYQLQTRSADEPMVSSLLMFFALFIEYSDALNPPFTDHVRDVHQL
jgi:DNA-directed RNA polymerase subunit M/transcription elongation factor TFIIS